MPAFTGLLAPHWRPDARGVILGLSTFTRSAHIVRALLEAIAWQVCKEHCTLICFACVCTATGSPAWREAPNQ